MTRTVLLTALLPVLVLARAGTAQAAAEGAEGPCKILVLDLEGKALPEEDRELPALLSASLASEVAAVSRCDVISQAEIRAMLNTEKQRVVCTGDSDSCVAEIGQAFGADRVIAGTLGKLGADYLLSARLMNVKKGEVVARTEEPRTNTLEDLHRVARNAGRRLLGAAPLPVPEADATAAPGLLWAGIALGVVGGAATVGGAVAVTVAEVQLADRNVTTKGDARTMGQLALVVGVAGLIVGVAGAGMAFVSGE